MHTVSLEIARELKEVGFDKSSNFYHVPTGTVKDWKSEWTVKHKSQIRFFKHAIPAYTLGELIRHPFLKDYKYFWDEIQGGLLFWAEPPMSDCIEDLYSETTPEDTLGLALVDELKKAKQKDA